MAARLIRGASRLLALPVSFQPLPTLVPSECARIALLAPPLPCQVAAALHTSPLCHLAESLPEASSQPTLEVSPKTRVSRKPELEVSPPEPEPELEVSPEPELEVSPEPELEVSREPELEVSADSTFPEDEAFISKVKLITDVEELLGMASKGKLHGSRGVVVLQQIVRLTSDNPGRILADRRLQKLLKDINGKIGQIWNKRLVRLLRCLYDLGLSGQDLYVMSAETEVKWRMRRLNIAALSYLLNFVPPKHDADDPKSLFNILLKEVELRWTEVRDVHTLLTLFTKLSSRSDTLMEKLEDKILELADSFTPKQSCRLIWQLANQKRRTSSVLQALSFHLHKKQSLPESLIADLAYSFYKLNFCHPQLLEKMANDLNAKLPHTNALHITRILRSYAGLRYANQPLCQGIAQGCMNRKEAFKTHFISILYSFAYLNFQPSESERFFNMIHQWLDLDFDSLPWYQQLEAVWSLCVLGHVTLAYLHKVLEPTFYEQILDGSSVHSRNLCLKLLQINGTAVLEARGYGGPLLPDNVVQHLQQRTALPTTTTTTEVLKAIFPAEGTCSLGVDTFFGTHLDCEVILDSKLQPVPIKEFVDPHNQPAGHTEPLLEGLKRIAVVSRDFNQYVFLGRDLMGQFVMNQRHLRAAGYLVVEVPYYEWQEMKSEQEKQRFLKEQIKKAVMADNLGL